MLYSTPRAIFLAILLPLATQAQTKDTPGDLFGPATKGQISSLPDAIKKQASCGKATLYAVFRTSRTAKSASLSIAFATPGLWEVPAMASTSFWLGDERLQGVLSMSPP